MNQPTQTNTKEVAIMRIADLKKAQPLFDVVLTWADGLDTYYLREDFRTWALLNSTPRDKYVAVESFRLYLEPEEFRRIDRMVTTYLLPTEDLVRFQYK